jgi:hypothetical protein
MDLDMLQQAGLVPTLGDARCLLFGHLTRLSVWQLRPNWHNSTPVLKKLARVKTVLQQIYPLDLLDRFAAEMVSSLSEVDLLASMRVNEEQSDYDIKKDEVSF